MAIAGIGWASINVNSYPMIVEMSKSSDIGNNIDRTIGLCDNAVFIGDSLTVGQYYISNSSSYRNFYNYPYFLKKMMQINNITELARSGATSSSWWNEFANDITATNSIYFVWLGTNDNFTDTVSTDCAGDDYTQYANTETGNMGKILAKIKSLDGNKIILLINLLTILFGKVVIFPSNNILLRLFNIHQISVSSYPKPKPII